MKTDPTRVLSESLIADRLERSRSLNKENVQGSKAQQGIPFSELLEQRIEERSGSKAVDSLKFSAHAQSRLESRGIELSPDEMVKLQEAVNKARDKGAKESLILTDKAAFIVSVKNQTVITAVDRESIRENVFTNIDSTVMI